MNEYWTLMWLWKPLIELLGVILAIGVGFVCTFVFLALVEFSNHRNKK